MPRKTKSKRVKKRKIRKTKATSRHRVAKRAAPSMQTKSILATAVQEAPLVRSDAVVAGSSWKTAAILLVLLVGILLVVWLVGQFLGKA